MIEIHYPPAAEIGAGEITEAMVKDGAITNDKVAAAAAIADSKINPVPSTALSTHVAAADPHTVYRLESTALVDADIAAAAAIAATKIAGTAATLDGAETLTNKTINASQLVDASVVAAKLAAGMVVQTVFVPFATQTSWADTGVFRHLFQATITPKKSTSTIIALAFVGGCDNAGSGRLSLNIYYETTSGGITGTNLAVTHIAQDSTSVNGAATGVLGGSVALGNTTTTYFKLLYSKNDAGGTNYVCMWSSTAGILLLEVA